MADGTMADDQEESSRHRLSLIGHLPSVIAHRSSVIP